MLHESIVLNYSVMYKRSIATTFSRLWLRRQQQRRRRRWCSLMKFIKSMECGNSERNEGRKEWQKNGESDRKGNDLSAFTTMRGSFLPLINSGSDNLQKQWIRHNRERKRLVAYKWKWVRERYDVGYVVNIIELLRLKTELVKTWVNYCCLFWRQSGDNLLKNFRVE